MAGTAPGTVRRRPLPALIALVALLILTAVVWIRVLNRSSGAAGPSPSGSACSSVAPKAALPNPAAVNVLVLNSTKRQGIAAAARRDLQQAGFQSTQPAGNDPNKVKVTGVAEIRFGPTGKTAAALVHYYFPGATLAGSGRITTPLVTVALGAKYTTVASVASVKAAMARAHVATSSAPPPPAPTGSTSPSGSPSVRTC